MHHLDRLLAHTVFARSAPDAPLCRDCLDDRLRDELAALSWGQSAGLNERVPEKDGG